MNAHLSRFPAGPLILMLCVATYGCGDATEPGSDSTQTSKAVVQPATTATITTTANKPSIADAQAINGQAATNSSVNHQRAADMDLVSQATAMDPGRPQRADGRSNPVGSQLVAPTRRTALATDCTVDFTDQTMLQLSEPSLWAERIYLPWYQQCNSAGFVDFRATVQGHFHLNFADPKVGYCVSHPQYYPSRIDPDGTCHYVNIPTEPRTYVTSHGSNERFLLRTQRPDGNTWAAFDLNRFRVVGTAPVKLCFKTKASANGPWEAAEPSNGAPGAWWCWNELGQGLWDLSGSAYELVEVSIEPSPAAPGTIQIDDFSIAIRY